jgi:hypothetical protein
MPGPAGHGSKKSSGFQKLPVNKGREREARRGANQPQLASPQTPIPTPLLHHKLQPLPAPTPATPLLPPAFQPPRKILTLTNIKHIQHRTTLNHSLDARACNAHTATDAQLAELEQVQAYRP